MSFDVDNRKVVFVAKDISRTAKTSLSELVDGEIVLTAAGTATLQGASDYSAYDEIRIACKVDGKIHFTAPIDYKNINLESYQVKAYSAPVNFVKYIGYNGTTGELEAPTAGVTYTVVLERNDILMGTYDKFYNNKASSWYAYDTSLGQVGLATGIYEELAINHNNEIDGWVKIEMVYSGAGTVLGGSSTLTVVNGSKTAIASSASHGLVAGDYVRIGGTALTTPVYKVDSINSTVIKLTTPYTGTSATVANANVLEINDATTGDFGIKLTGVDKSVYSTGRFYFDMFDAGIWLRNGFDTNATLITESTKVSKGNGSFGEVADAEWQAYESGTNQYFEHDSPPKSTPLNAVSGKTYDVMSMSPYFELKSFVQGKRQNYQNILVAIPVSSDQGDYNAANTHPVGVVTGIDNWIEDKTGTNPNRDASLT